VKKKHQRLVLLLLAVGAVLGAILLAMWGLRDNASFFYAPEDIAKQGRPPVERAVRVGGMVRRIERLPDGVSIRFTIGDNSPHTIQARYSGITPELFREGTGVIADGRFQADGSFLADEILARHDENYMPPELTERGMHKTDRVR
jgi:cytochrome c-type biogenesis protein CcmE